MWPGGSAFFKCYASWKVNCVDTAAVDLCVDMLPHIWPMRPCSPVSRGRGGETDDLRQQLMSNAIISEFNGVVCASPSVFWIPLSCIFRK